MSGVQGSNASQAWEREGLSMVTHLRQVGGVMAVSRFSREIAVKGKEGKCMECSKESPYRSASE